MIMCVFFPNTWVEQIFLRLSIHGLFVYFHSTFSNLDLIIIY